MSKMLLLLLLVIFVVTANFGASATSNEMITDPESMKAVAEGQNHFLANLHEKIKEDRKAKKEGGNFVTSSFSLGIAMAMLQEGARGDTEEQIKKGMHFPDKENLLEGFKSAIELSRSNQNITLEIANQIFLKEGFVVQKAYGEILGEFFDTKVTQTDFAENEGEVSRKLINDWVEEKTHAKIKDLIPQGMLDFLTSSVLVNAIYFKGDWVRKFDIKKTTDQDFYVKEDKTVKVKMMEKGVEELKMINIENLNSEMIEIPYKDNRTSMYIILPDLKTDLDDVEMELSKMNTKLNMLEIFSKIDEEEARNVTVKMPKFKLESTIDLSEVLKKLGMEQMFTDKADFSGMIQGEDLSVSHAIQKAFIEVNEEGSEAAAATAIVHSTRISSGIPSFVCNRPFIFFIRDKLTSMVLFSGRVVDPTQI